MNIFKIIRCILKGCEYRIRFHNESNNDVLSIPKIYYECKHCGHRIDR